MVKKIILAGFICNRCTHKWPPRNENSVPKVCPKCKSPYWDRPRKSKHTAKEKIELMGYKCERCPHKWVPRDTSSVPKVCPKCKSPYWDRPRKTAVLKKGVAK